METNFCIFILTYSRANNVITYKTLLDNNYKGLIYLIIDNTDPEKELYIKKYNDKVICFDKIKQSKLTDNCNNFNVLQTITFARNACFDIAKKLNIKYFLQLDDDYTNFSFRINNNLEYPKNKFKIKYTLEKCILSVLEYYKSINAITIALSQGGDWIGGTGSAFYTYPIRRKVMNSFYCSTDRPFKFVGTFNEDVNTYTTLGSTGHLMFTIPFLNLDQKATQKNKGGITETYKKYGTYCKSFTTVINMPSSVYVDIFPNKRNRLHHIVKWINTVPCILDEKYKK